jgi:hypothetical protein
LPTLSFPFFFSSLLGHFLFPAHAIHTTIKLGAAAGPAKGHADRHHRFLLPRSYHGPSSRAASLGNFQQIRPPLSNESFMSTRGEFSAASQSSCKKFYCPVWRCSVCVYSLFCGPRRCAFLRLFKLRKQLSLQICFGIYKLGLCTTG